MIVWVLVIAATALASGAIGALLAIRFAPGVRGAVTVRPADAPAQDRRADKRAGILLPLAIALAGAVIVGAVGVISSMRSPASEAGAGQPAHPGGDARAMVAQLEAELARNPGDPGGWATLGWSYMRLDQPADAAEAFARAAALDPSAGAYRSDRGEALSVAAGGEVTEDAIGEFEAALAINPADPVARYYLAMAQDQAGDHAAAVDSWLAQLADAPSGSPLEAALRDAIEGAAAAGGVDISDRLPPGPAMAGVPAKGPDAAQMAAAGALSDADRSAMIAGMVDGLAARLEAQPRDAEGWATLMRSRMNLGQTAEAAQALQAGLAAFSDAPAEQARLRETARGLGIPNA